MGSNLLTFPPEIISIIVSMVEIEDYVFLKMSCKAMAACMPRNLVHLIRSKQEELADDMSETSSDIPDLARVFFDVHQKMESRARSLFGPEFCLLCLTCGHVKHPKAFADKQRAVAMARPGVWTHRYCVKCGILFYWDLDFSGHRYFGVESYGCQACLQMRPVLDFLHERARDHDLLVAIGVDNGRICIDCVERSENDNTWDFDIVARNKQLKLRHEGFDYWLKFETGLLESMGII